MPTSTNADDHQPPGDGGLRFEVGVAADGWIEYLTEVSTAGGRRSLQAFSREGLVALTRGHHIEYRFDDDRRLRGIAYLEVLASLRQEVLLTAHKVRHGELLDEPESVPILRALLHRIEAAETAFRTACRVAGVWA